MLEPTWNPREGFLMNGVQGQATVGDGYNIHHVQIPPPRERDSASPTEVPKPMCGRKSAVRRPGVFGNNCFGTRVHEATDAIHGVTGNAHDQGDLAREWHSHCATWRDNMQVIQSEVRLNAARYMAQLLIVF